MPTLRQGDRRQRKAPLLFGFMPSIGEQGTKEQSKVTRKMAIRIHDYIADNDGFGSSKLLNLMVQLRDRFGI
jgi:hypothetical protein